MAESRVTTWDINENPDGSESIAIDDGENSRILLQGVVFTKSNNSSSTVVLANPQYNTIEDGLGAATISGGGRGGSQEAQILEDDASFATISGGYDNRCGQIAGNIAGGAHHVLVGPVEAGSSASHGTIGGGSSCQILSGEYSTIAGGGGIGNPNISVGNFTTISGGGANTIDGTNGTISGGSGHSISTGSANTIGGGSNNTIQGIENGCTIAGGLNNTAQGNNATIAGGNGNTANGNYSCILGGNNCEATGAYSFSFGLGAEAHASYSVAFGTDVEANITGSINIASRDLGAKGGCQSIQFTMGAITDGDETEWLSTTGASGTATLPPNSAWIGTAHVVGRDVANGEVITVNLPLAGKVVAGAGSDLYGGLNDQTRTEYTINEVGAPENVYSQFHSSAIFRINVEGVVGKIIHWAARIEVTQVI